MWGDDVHCKYCNKNGGYLLLVTKESIKIFREFTCIDCRGKEIEK